MGNSGCFPQGKPAVTELRYPTYGACWMFLCFHNLPNSAMDYGIFNVRTDVNACECTQGVYWHPKRVSTESWLWEKNPLPHQGIKPALAACQSDALPTELHPRPDFPCRISVWIYCSGPLFIQQKLDAEQGRRNPVYWFKEKRTGHQGCLRAGYNFVDLQRSELYLGIPQRPSIVSSIILLSLLLDTTIIITHNIRFTHHYKLCNHYYHCSMLQSSIFYTKYLYSLMQKPKQEEQTFTKNESVILHNLENGLSTELGGIIFNV